MLQKIFIGFLTIIIVLGISYFKNSLPVFKRSSSLQFNPFDTLLRTDYSHLENQYLGFNSQNAINKLASIDNEYYTVSQHKKSRFYGTEWRKNIESTEPGEFKSYFQDYLKQNIKPDSLHCTLYAMKALKAGLGHKFEELDKLHQEIYKDHEFAGWSVGHILTKYFGWKAYLVLDPNSHEYESCLQNFKRDGMYHVWRQPNIKIEKVFVRDQDNLRLDSLLKLHEFSWGFSDQGWHTWITRFSEIKECNWSGTPSQNGSYMQEPSLIQSSIFIDYKDYLSHVLVFPPKAKSSSL